MCKDFGFGDFKGYRTHSISRKQTRMTLSLTNLNNDVTDSTTRDDKRLLRHLIGNPACNMIVGCNFDVLGIAGIRQGSVVVMTDADWAGDVSDYRSYSGIAVWVKGPVENTWYPVYASSTKQNIATRDQWSKNVQLLSWNYCAVHGQLSSTWVRETQGCESAHSPRGHQGPLYAGLGDGTWTTYYESTW